MSIKVKLFANSSVFKLSECEDVSIINIIEVKLGFFLCHIVLYANVKGWGQAVEASLS